MKKDDKKGPRGLHLFRAMGLYRIHVPLDGFPDHPAYKGIDPPRHSLHAFASNCTVTVADALVVDVFGHLSVVTSLPFVRRGGGLVSGQHLHLYDLRHRWRETMNIGNRLKDFIQRRPYRSNHGDAAHGLQPNLGQ